MMKKFLSSLLALTMILSLVIVPANAANAEIEGVWISSTKETLKVGESAKITFNAPEGKVGHKLEINKERVVLLSSPKISVVSSDTDIVTVDRAGSIVTATAKAEGTATITYTYECDYQRTIKDPRTTASQVMTTTVEVKAATNPTKPEKPEVTAASGVVTVSTVATNVKEGDDVTFTVIAKIKDSNNEEHDATVTDATWSHAGKFDKDKGTLTVKAPASDFTVSATGIKLTASDNSNLSLSDSAKIKVNASKVSVTSNQSEANKAFDTAVKAAKAFTYNSRPATLTGSTISYIAYTGDSKTGADAIGFSGKIDGYKDIQVVKVDDTHVKVTAKPSSGDPKSVESTQFALSSTTPSVTFTTNLTSGKVDKAIVAVGGEISVSAVLTNAEARSYEWLIDGVTVGTETGYRFDKEHTKKPGNIVLTCKAYADTDKKLLIASNTFTLTISDAKYTLKVEPKELSLYQLNVEENLKAGLYDNSTNRVVSGATYTFTTTSAGKSVINLTDKKDGTAKVSLKKQGDAIITVTASYQGIEIEETININGMLRSGELEKVKNGEKLEISYNDLKTLAADAINKRGVTVSGSIEIFDAPTTASSGGALYKSKSSTSATTGAILTSGDSVLFKSTAGLIGTYSMKIKVTGSDGVDYVIAVSIPVVSADTIKGSVVGTEAKKDVTFTNDDYKYLYYTTSKVSDFTGYYDGDKVSKFDGPVKEDKTVTIPASAFKDKSSVTLNVVGVDKDGVASTGTIEVSQKSYGIKYSVVAGESVTFDQKRFESFMEDYADDNIKTSKGDYFEFDYVKFDSLPNSTREGVLYEGKDKIKTSTEVENLDKVTFESVTKAKDTIKVPFTLYAKQYDKNDKVIDKKVSMTGEVVISVVKEDIVFEVGVNSAVKLGSDKFIDFLRDSDKSYKKADLDYVTFDVGKNSAITSYFNGTGALYRYYNGSTGINSTVSAKDEFYYNPKTSSKHYDLDDVTYVTSKFAKVGDIVYIPFTAYGTKSGQKAEGTIAIKVKQTMNFVDVRPGDYFYDSVQWAVNLDITKGTSATTFSPKQGCTRAQIVTFLWRAANSPAPRSSTNKFTDVYATTHADYMKAIIWATEQGITTGTGNGKFSPDATCTRAQIVTFLYRFKNNPAVYGSLNFSDVNKTEHAAFYNAILWAVNNKITTGYGNGIFDPNGTCNRGDAVTFLYRALA